jgi:rubrerythrin
MSADRKAVLDSIMRAMEIEKETFDFYVKAEQKTFDAGGKRIFRWLAKSEEQHYLKLTELYSSLEQGGRWVFYGGSTVIFEEEEAAKLSFTTNDLQALEIAMDIEKKGIAYFEKLMGETVDPDGKAMLTTLRNEEAEHLRIISEKYDALRA